MFPWCTQIVKILPAVWETSVQSLGWEDLLEEGMATHSSILAWRIPWTEEGYSSWVTKESDTTEQLTHTHLPKSLKPLDGKSFIPRNSFVISVGRTSNCAFRSLNRYAKVHCLKEWKMLSPGVIHSLRNSSQCEQQVCPRHDAEQ